MASRAEGFFIATNGVIVRIGPSDPREWARHEALVRADYERCHPEETFDDLKRRARFSKEDCGLLCDWMTLAAWRAAEAASQRLAA
jgi:hypothetical protein